MSVANKSRRQILAAAVGLVSLHGLYADASTFSWNDTTFASGTPGSWSDSTNWSPVGIPGTSDVASFGAIGASGTAGDVTNVVDATTTITSLVYNELATSSQFQTTQINAGVTLNLNGTGGNALLVGTETDAGNTVAVQANITGAGSLSINNPTGLFMVRQSSASNSSQKAVLDMSGLANFTATVSEFDVGVGTTNGGRGVGSVTLANTNAITATTARIGAEQSGNSTVSTLFLGQTNNLNVATLLVAERRGTGQLQFNSTITNGQLTIRGTNGTGPATFWGIAYSPNATDSSNGGGTVDLTSGTGRGHGTLDALVNNLVIGRQDVARFTGRLTYDLGGITTDNITLGDGNGVAAPTGIATGILQVQGTGTMLVNGNMTLGKNSGNASANVPVGTLTLGTSTTPGGDIRVAGDILDGGGTSTITVNGANLQARTIGSAANPIDGLSLNGGTLTVSLGTGGTPVNVAALTANANANGNITVNLNVAGQVALGQQKLIDYATIAGTGFGAFTLAPKFPARLQATLVDNPGDSIDVNVTSFDNPRWNGNSSSDWDIDHTQNWLLVNAGTPTTYQEDLSTYTTTDSVLFDDNATGSRNVNITTNVSPNSVTVSANGNYTFGGPGAIIGGHPITKSGGGRLTIVNTGANANGVVTVNGGTLQIGDGVTSGAGNIGGTIVNNAGAAVLLNRPDDFTFPNSISGSGSLEKNGAGIATLTAASTYTGPTIIDSGTLVATGIGTIGAASSIGAGDNTSGTTNQNSIVLNGGTLKWVGTAGQSSNRAFTLTPNGGTIDASPTGSFGLNLNATTLSVNMSGTGSRTLTLTGIDPAPLLVSSQQLGLVLGDPSGGILSVVKNGSAGWILNGSNTYTGGTVINSGRIRTGNATAFGTGSVQVASGGQAYINTVATFNNDFYIAGIGPSEQPNGEILGNYGSLRLAATNSFVAGKVVLTGDARITARSTSGGIPGTISGQVTGPFNLEIGNAGSGGGTLALSNTSNDWSGNTTISHGELRLAASEVIPNGPGKGDVTVNGSSSTVDAVLNINGNTETINGLNSSGDLTHVRVTNGAATNNGTLIVGDNNASGNCGGLIQDGTATLAITKIGSGVQVLSGSNTYSGPTTIAGGTLLAKGPAHASILANAVVNSGTLALDYSGGATDPAAAVQSALTASASTSFVGGAIRTTNAPDPTRAIGWSDDTTNSVVTLRYTYAGDATLDGQVGPGDFVKLAQNFNSSTNVTWAMGDFNYDGVINALDFNALATNFGAPPLPSPGLTTSLGTLVPEPSSLAVLALGGLVAVRRRRSR